jgi:hypothetical protein
MPYKDPSKKESYQKKYRADHMCNCCIYGVVLIHQKPYLFLQSLFTMCSSHPAGVSTHCVVKINNPFDIVRYRDVSQKLLDRVFG